MAENLHFYTRCHMCTENKQYLQESTERPITWAIKPYNIFSSSQLTVENVYQVNFPVQYK